MKLLKNLSWRSIRFCAAPVLLCLHSLSMSPVYAAETPGPVQRERPAFNIDNKPYYLKDLTGFTLSELRAQFDAELKTMSDDRLAEVLRARGPAFAGSSSTVRQVQERQLWKFAIGSLLDRLAGDLVLATIFDRIVKEQEIEVGEYFDMAALHEGMQRQIGYLDFIYQHQHDATWQEDKLHAEAVEKFRFKMTRDYWKEIGPEFRSRPAFKKWPLEALHCAGQNGDYKAKAMLAHYLLQQACEEGVYYAQGREVFRFYNPPPQLIEISGYRGSRENLQSLLAQVVDSNGIVKSRPASEAVKWLQELAPGATVKMVFAPATETPLLLLPTLGALYEVAPGNFRMYARLPERAAAVATPESEKGLNLFYRLYAYRIAASTLMPDIQSWVQEWEPSATRFADNIADPGIGQMPEVAFDSFIKKPYPDTVFADLEQHRSDLHELAASAARVTLAKDRTAAGKLKEVLMQKSENARTAPVQKAYRAVLQRLSTQSE